MVAISEVRRFSKKNSRKRIVFLQRHLLLTGITLILICICVVLGTGFSAAAKNTNHSNEVYKYYTSIQVESGDTLWGIADKYISLEHWNYDTYIEEVITLNHMNDEKIHAGQYLMIPYYSSDYK